MQQFQESLIERLKENLDVENSEPYNNIVQEIGNVYQPLVNKNFKPVRELFGDNEIYFITGPPRTGGTYLLKALIELRNEQITDYNHKMIFDYCPRSTMLGAEYGSSHTSKTVFEWAQWMVWTKRRFDLETYDFIPKKHIGMLFQLGLFEGILGDKANFIISIRHPGEAFQSYIERFLPNYADPENYEESSVDVGLWKMAVLPRTNLDEDRWNELGLPDKFLLYWCACYLEVLNYDKPERLEVLRFGPDYSRFLQKFEHDHETIYFPEKFEPTPREELPDFSDHCVEMQEKVEDMREKKFGKKLY